jgi:hypothetical protein
MNVNSPDRASKRPRQFIAALIAGLFVFASVIPGSSASITVLDTLGAATPDTQFSVFGAGGTSILPSQFVGPQFTLTQPTTLTEVGGFMNNCISIVGGVPLCPGTLPLTVQIRPSVNGVPDPFTVLGSFSLTHDNDPLTVSYESVALNLTLQPGTYFALFAPHNADQGFLLESANVPFNYQAGLITMGVLNPFTGNSSASQQFGAVRILGETSLLIDGCDTEVSDILLPGAATISDLVRDCAESATNHGQFVNCISHLTNDLKRSGFITVQEKSGIQKCAAQADIP